MLKTSAQSKAGTEAGGLPRERRKSSTSPEGDGTHQRLAEAGLIEDQSSAESRLDPITGNWTIFAPGRDSRPNEFVATPQTETAVDLACPFCSGAESETPPPVWVGCLSDPPHTAGSSGEPTREVYREGELAAAAGKAWSVRVVPNKFPAITAIDPRRLRKPAREPALFDRKVISGAHEVIIESPRHVGSLTELDLSEVALAFMALRDRVAYWTHADGINYISAFKNVGGDAGASLRHSHSQLIAFNIIPPHVRNITERLTTYRAKTGCCLQCDLIRGELKDEARVIANTDSLVAYCPFASPLAMMVRITSVEHGERFDQLEDEKLDSVSRMVFRVIYWLERLHPGTAYNMILNSRPPGMEKGSDAYHWSIDVFPRLSHVAGFEFSSNCMINPVMPELAAAHYRACRKAEDPRLVL